MTEHFTRSTVSAAFYCKKCGKVTQHRIDDRRKGPCLECIDKLEAKHEESVGFFEAFRPSRQMSEVAARAVAAGVPVKVRKGVEYLYVNDATYAYLSAPHRQIEVPVVCTCAQRLYAHELSVHPAIRFESRTLRWPWSLRFAPTMGAP